MTVRVVGVEEFPDWVDLIVLGVLFVQGLLGQGYGFGERSHAFRGHSYDRDRDRVYRSLLLLGSHSGHWRRRLTDHNNRLAHFVSGPNPPRPRASPLAYSDF